MSARTGTKTGLTMRLLMVFLVTAGVLLPGSVGGAAGQGGGTYTIRGGGDLDWQPSSGGFGPLSSPDLNSASGTLSDANGSATYSITAGPGLVRATLDGSLSGPGRFDPTLQGDSTTELTVSGAPGSVTATLNLHVDSTFRVDQCAGICSVGIGVGGPGGFTRIGTGSGVTQNDLGLTADPIPGGYHLHGDVTTREFGMATNTPTPVTISVQINVAHLSSNGAPSSFEVLPTTVSFATAGPVLNVPIGYTVSGSGVVDNHWIDPATAPPSTPPASVPPTVGTINGPIAFTSTRDSSSGDIYVMGATGSLPSRLTADPGIDVEPAWSPDGTKIAFATNRSSNFDIFAMGADGGASTPLTSDPANDRQPAWSPDGSKIAFVSDRDGNDEIYVMSADGTGPVRLTNNAAHDTDPAWSPDGSMLAFASNRDGNDEIYVMGATGSAPINITNDAAADNSPAWSPDGASLTFSSDRDGDFEIFTSAADGTAVIQRTSNAVFDGSPSWSPDGTLIGFTSLRDGDFELYVTGANGANPTNLTSNPGSDDSFDWRHSTVLAPTTPLVPRATASASGLVVAWSAPTTGAPVTGYVVTCAQGTTRQQVNVDANTLTATIVGLNGTTRIDCTIVATSADGSGPAASLTFTPTTTNHTPTAVLDLVNTTDGSPGVPAFSSDDGRLNGPVTITQNADDLGVVEFEARRSNDVDGRSDIVSYTTTLTGPLGSPTRTQQTYTSPTGTLKLNGSHTQPTTWSVNLVVADAAGATSTVSVVVTVQPTQRSATNRAPTAILTEMKVNAGSGGLVNVDPGLSYDPDPLDGIASWDIVLWTLDGVVGVQSGTGAPPRAVPVRLPVDHRSGFMYVELMVYDGDGAQGDTFEIIAFNQCSSAVDTVELPDAVLDARKAALAPDASRIGPVPKMQVHVSSTGSASENLGLYKTGSTATIDISDESFHRTGGTIVERELVDLTGDASMYANNTPLYIRSNSPIKAKVVLTNPLNIPMPVVFALSTRDSNGITRTETILVVVGPSSPAILRLNVARDATIPAAIVVTPNASGAPGQLPWRLTSLGLGNADVDRVHDSTQPLAAETITVPRAPGQAMHAKFRLTYGGADLDDSALWEQSVCLEYDLPVLSQRDANKPPTVAVTPAVQHATGTARLHLVIDDPDPAMLGDAAADFAGRSPTDVVGIFDVTVDGQDPAAFGAVYAPGSDHLVLDVELPATAVGRKDVSVVARDFFGGTTTASATIYFDPPNQAIQNATLSLQHSGATVARGVTVVENVGLATPTFVPLVLLALDLPRDATFIDATTSGLNAITAASQPIPMRWTCTQYVDSAKTRLVCSFLNVVPTPNFVYPPLLVRLSSTSATTQFPITAGVMQPSLPVTFDEHLAALRDVTSPTSLPVKATDFVRLTGFTADAGPDQTVDAVTVAPDSSQAPTHVTLDGSLSTNDGRPQTYLWRQTAGPTVTWLTPTTGTGASLRATGQQAQFSAPTIKSTTQVRFELSVSAPAVPPGLPAQTKTDTVTITLNPPPNRAPSITALTTTPDTTNATPNAATTVTMNAATTDPDGDRVALTWRVWQGAPATTTTVRTAAVTNETRTLEWPSNVRQLTVEIRASDNRGGIAVRTFVLGVPLAKIALAVSGTIGRQPLGPLVSTASAGQPISLRATTNRPPTGAISWSVVSGPAIPGTSFPVTGSTLDITAPTVGTAGVVLVVRATVVDTTGSATVDTTIALEPASPPTVSLVVWPGTGAPPEPGSGLLDFLQPVLVPPGGVLSAAATGSGTGTLHYAWTASPAIVFSSSSSASTTMTAPSTDSFVTVKVRVTDSAGLTAEATRLVQVGAGIPPIDLTCAGSSVMNDLIRQARDNANRAGGLLDVVVPLGVPPIGTVNLGKLTFTGDCSTAPSLAFTGATFSLFNGFFGGSGLGGSVTTDRVCITAGSVTVPPELGMGTAPAGTTASPLCISLDPSAWLRADPPLPTPPAPSPADPPRGAPSPTPPDDGQFRLPQIVCPPGVSPITGSIVWSNAFPGINLGGVTPKKTTARFDCGFLELTSTASAPWGDLALRGLARRDGSFEAAVVTKGLRLFGKSSNTDLTGTFSRSANGSANWQAAADIATPALGVAALNVSSIHVALGSTGFAFSATANLSAGGSAPDISGTLSGTITGQDEFTGSLAATLSSPWTPVTGLTIAGGALSASIARVAGATTFDVALSINGSWQPVSAVTVTQITARLTNRGAPPECAITAGTTWAEVTGNASVDIGSPAPVINVTVRACIGLTQPSVVITSTADLNSWKPVPSVDFTFSSVGLTVAKPANGDWTVAVTGSANFAGITLAGRAQFTPLTGSFVLDAAGDLSGLHLGPLSSGHVVFATTALNGYVPVALASDPPSGAPPIDLLPGLAAFADITLDAGMRTALDKIINPPAPQPKVLPIPESIRFVAQLGGASVRLKASLAFPPGQGLTLFAICPDTAPHVGGKCVVDNKLTTSLQLSALFISIDTTGRLGFGGEGDLHLASNDGVAPASSLHVVVEASIELTAPAINLALYFTGAWNNALGIDGLILSNLAIQFGVSFATYPPVPTVGFGATVEQLPPDLAKMLGIQSDQPEPMRLVASISPTKPIFEFTLGVADGHDFLKPVQPISAANANALTIDYASLVFAPLGGDVGPYHYEPGISVGFAGSAFGVDASGAARVTLVPPNIHADLDVGDIVLGTGAATATIKATHFLFDVALDHVVVEASGGLAITGGPVATVTFNVNAKVSPASAKASFALDITNWNLPFPGASVRELHASALIAASISSLPAGQLSLDGILRAGAVDVTSTGSITLTNGRVSAMSMKGSVSSFSIGGIAVGGPGCDGTGPQDGACVSAAYNPAQAPPLSMGLAGSIGVADYSANISGSFGPTGVHATGSLNLSTLGNLTITGDLWFGSALANVTALDGLGVSRHVHAGDFRFTATSSPGGVLAGTSLAIDLGRIGGTPWIKGGGTLVVSQRPLGSATIVVTSNGFTASGQVALPSPVSSATLVLGLSGSFSFPTSFSQLGFTLTGTLGTQSSSADPALRALSQGSFTLKRLGLNGSPTVFSFDGNISLPGLSGSLSGNVSTSLNYCLTGSLSFPGLGVNGSGSVGTNCDDPGLWIHLVKSGFTFDGQLKAGGATLSASYTDVRQGTFVGAHPYHPPTDNRNVRDVLRVATKVNGSLHWSSNGFNLTSSFAASAHVTWTTRLVSNGNIIATPFDGTLDVSISGSQACVSLPGFGSACAP